MARRFVADGGLTTIYGMELGVHSISSSGQPVRGGPPGFVEVLPSPHPKNVECCETFRVASDLD